MIRPQWLRHSATALYSSHKRCEFLIASCTFSSTSTTQPDPQWPLLKKRTRPSDEDNIHSGGTSLIESLKSRQDPVTAELAALPNTQDAVTSKSDSRVMLIMQGLSTNLNASDFYRLAPSDLSSWQSVIKKGTIYPFHCLLHKTQIISQRTVQQQRNSTTLEPLGRYHISFSSSTAAISYRDRLLRLHVLSHHKLNSLNGLWESSIPPQLKSPTGDDPPTELEGFTVTPGTQKSVDIQRRRVSVTNKWAQQLRGIVKKFEYGDQPPVVLVHTYPPTLTANDFGGFIREDGFSRGCKWKVCPPQDLHSTASTGRGYDEDSATWDLQPPSQQDIDAQEKLKSRFVIVCANEAEARRFHRHWNQRTLTASPGEAEATRNIVHASIINW